MTGPELPGRLVLATGLVVLVSGAIAWMLGGPAVGLGLYWGGLAGLLYLALLARWTRVFVVRAQGGRLGWNDRLILLGGRALRMGWVAVAFVGALRSPIPINLWATVGGFLIYRILLFGVMGVQAVRAASGDD